MKNLLKKRLKSLQKAELYLEPMRASTMEIFFVNILNGLCFCNASSIIDLRLGYMLYVGLWRYWDFQSEVKVEQIIAIVMTHSVSCLVLFLIGFLLKPKLSFWQIFPLRFKFINVKNLHWKTLKRKFNTF